MAAQDSGASRAPDERIELQPTLPMQQIPQTPRDYVFDEIGFDIAGQGERVEQQPTRPIEKAARRVTEVATPHAQAVATKPAPAESRPAPRRGHHISPLRMSLIGLFLIFFIASGIIGHTTLEAWLGAIITPISHVVHPPAAATADVHPRPTPTPTTAARITAEAQTFMNAFMLKDWSKLWSMLSPDTQNLYNGESDLIHFEQTKFGALTLLQYQLGKAEMVQSWRDPDTLQVYPLAALLPVSMDATGSSSALSSLSIADLHNGLFHATTLAFIPQNGQWLVALAGPADLDAPILVPATAPHTQLLVPIFMYHHVSNKPTTNILDYSLTVTDTDFNAQLDWLQQQGYHSIDMTELFDALYYGKALPPHPMILTFDDGYEDVYTDALPILLAHHYRGVFHIITGMIGGNYMTWNQVRDLQAQGMQVASHTVHHVNVGEPPYGTTTQEELTQSKDTLQKLLGIPIQFFCYPSGEPFHHDTVAEQQMVLQDLYQDGYIGATLDPSAFDSAIQDAQMPYELPRIRVSGGETLDSFIGILNSVLTYDAQQIS
jgi:peptidoglycan/xylan/chitin deacetylase (PgdA/CDA1 family)